MIGNRFKDGLDVVFVARDDDRDPGRLVGHRKVRDSRKFPFALVFANPVPEAEGWLLLTFNPTSTHQRQAHKDLTSALKFDPCSSHDRLTSTKKGAETDAKVIAKTLFGADPEGEAEVIHLDIKAMVARSTTSGLKEFVDEVDATVEPLLRP